MLHGYTPFKGKNDYEKCNNILANNRSTFDSSISPEACDIIQKILEIDLVDRISMEEIFKHEWMKKYEQFYKIDFLSYIFSVKQTEQDKAATDNKELSNSSDNESTETGTDVNIIHEKNISTVDDKPIYNYRFTKEKRARATIQKQRVQTESNENDDI